jgi:hypothetical protein
MNTSSDSRTLLSRPARWVGGVTLRAGVAAIVLASAALGGTFGKVVPIGGQAPISPSMNLEACFTSPTSELTGSR